MIEQLGYVAATDGAELAPRPCGQNPLVEIAARLGRRAQRLRIDVTLQPLLCDRGEALRAATVGARLDGSDGSSRLLAGLCNGKQGEGANRLTGLLAGRVAGDDGEALRAARHDPDIVASHFRVGVMVELGAGLQRR